MVLIRNHNEENLIKSFQECFLFNYFFQVNH